MQEMKTHTKTRLSSLFVGCISLKQVFGWGRSGDASELPLLPNRQPFSEAELKQCEDALNPLGYTLTVNIENNEVILYRKADLEEQQRVAGLILQTLLKTN